MALTYSACEWCGRLARSRDQDGDPACAPGEGCARPATAPRPYGRRATVNGTTLTVREWAQRCGVHESTLYREARRGALETAIADRLARRRTRSVEDQRVKRHRRAIADVAAVLGLTREAVRKRLRRVGSLERVLALGPKCPGHTGRRPARGRSLDAIRARTERDEAHALLRHYEDSAAEESRVDLVVVVLSLIGTATVLVALVRLVVLALRLAGGAA